MILKMHIGHDRKSNAFNNLGNVDEFMEAALLKAQVPVVVQTLTTRWQQSSVIKTRGELATSSRSS